MDTPHMPETTANAQKVAEALKVLSENMPYVIQKCADGLSWITVDQVTGKTAAFDLVAEMTKKHPDFRWRYLPRNEADRLAEGVNIGLKMLTRQAAKQNQSKRVRRPKSYKPMNL